jgi:hypothetical protein
MGPFANISSRRHAPRGGRVRRWRWRLAWPPGVPRSQTSGSYTRLTRTARDCGSSQSHVLLRQRRSRTVARGGGQWRSPGPHLTKQSLGWHQPSSVLVFNGGGKHWPDGSGAPPLLIPAKMQTPGLPAAHSTWQGTHTCLSASNAITLPCLWARLVASPGQSALLTAAAYQEFADLPAKAFVELGNS